MGAAPFTSIRLHKHDCPDCSHYRDVVPDPQGPKSETGYARMTTCACYPKDPRTGHSDNCKAAPIRGFGADCTAAVDELNPKIPPGVQSQTGKARAQAPVCSRAGDDSYMYQGEVVYGFDAWYYQYHFHKTRYYRGVRHNNDNKKAEQQSDLRTYLRNHLLSAVEALAMIHTISGKVRK